MVKYQELTKYNQYKTHAERSERHAKAAHSGATIQDRLGGTLRQHFGRP